MQSVSLPVAVVSDLSVNVCSLLMPSALNDGSIASISLCCQALDFSLLGHF